MERNPLDVHDRVLVVYARASWTRPVAAALAQHLARRGLTVELADADTHAAPPPQDYDTIVVGTPQRLGRRARAIVAYVTDHRDALATMPAFWFAVGRRRITQPRRIARATGLRPRDAFAFVRPRWYVRWFGDPSAARATLIRELARVVVQATR